MKRKIILYIIASILSITEIVYAQEVTPDPEPVQEEITAPVKIIEEQPLSNESVQEFQTSIDINISSSTPVEEPVSFQSSFTPVLQDTATLLIRNGATILYQGEIIISTSTDPIQVVDLEQDIHEVPSNSVLALLLQADTISDGFKVNKLNYYDSFGAFYLKCIQIEQEDLCENWQYVLNNVNPWTGIDQTLVSSGDMIGIYFGNPYQIVFSTSTYYTDTPFTVTAQQYNYQNNTWGVRAGVTLGATIPDLNNPWSPIEITTIPVNDQGESIFTIATSGEYMIGIQEDYYYPSYPITISSSTAMTTTTTSPTATGGGSVKKEFNFEKALTFIGPDNSYGGSGLNSWVAIAFSAYDKEDSSLRNYVKSTTRLSSELLDNERQAMAILSLGEDPYNYKGINFIEAILKEFDGKGSGQFGELNQINDDIFALLVLSKVGYTLDDVEVKKTIEFLKLKQNNGIWENEDLTGAAIQALHPFVGDKDPLILNAKKALQKTSWPKSISTTSWVSMAMYDLGENWIKGGETVDDYFSDLEQQDNGSLTEGGNDLMTTAYAIPALLGKSWSDILQSVSRPSLESDMSSLNSNTKNASTTDIIATTTDKVILNVIDQQITHSTTTGPIGSVREDILKIEKNILSNDQKNIVQNTLSTTTPIITEENILLEDSNTTTFKEWWLYIVFGFLVMGGMGYTIKRYK